VQLKASTIQEQSEQTLHLNKPIAFVAFGLGLLLSLSLLSGDQQGRVNLLYLLLLYLVIPLVSVVFSCVSLFSDKGVNFAKLMVALPLTQFKITPFLRQLHHLNLDKYWFVMQSQAAAMAFSVASLLVLFILLLITDINFVWRSSLLSADDLLPALHVVAVPWSFWESAQPSLALLEQTQDSRMVTTQQLPNVYANWWPFIFATQIFYSFILRCALYGISRNWLKRKAIYAERLSMMGESSSRKESLTKTNHSNQEFKTNGSQNIVTDLASKDCKINNWSNIDENVLLAFSQLAAIDISQGNRLSPEQLYLEKQIILVKAWEPPLAELKDYMLQNRGYLLPIDWQARLSKPSNQSVQQPENIEQKSQKLDQETIEFVTAKTQHLNEWLRLIETLPEWQLYQVKI
jgi:hypothetical protein